MTNNTIPIIEAQAPRNPCDQYRQYMNQDELQRLESERLIYEKYVALMQSVDIVAVSREKTVSLRELLRSQKSFLCMGKRPLVIQKQKATLSWVTLLNCPLGSDETYFLAVRAQPPRPAHHTLATGFVRSAVLFRF